MEYVIEMLNITKDFPGIRANDDVTLRVKKGEIHALLGENGAGKSTLMSILFGLYRPNKGIIKVNGKEVQIDDPHVANDLGIGMVHQHFKLVENFTVTENIVLGSEPKKSFGRVDIEKATKKVSETSERYSLSVDPSSKIEDISVGMQQRVEILKMLYRDAEILIFDEPTAVLTPQEIDDLMDIMRMFAKEGKSIILITHKLKEILAVADTCTVLRRGKLVGTVDVADTNEKELAEMMVGREVFFQVDKPKREPGKKVVEIKGLTVKDNRKLKAVNNLSIDIYAGEILGLAGIDGNGQTELIEALTGLRKIESGKVVLNDVEISNYSIREITEAGIGHIPQDRHKFGLVLDFRLDENLVLQTYYQKPNSVRGILNQEAITKKAEQIIEEFDVRSGKGAETSARSMSGGNQQKAIIGREIDRSPAFLIAAQPTRGLDVGAIEYIHNRLVAEREKERAILLVSLELDEILNISDRIAVIYEGEIVGILDPEKTDEKEIGLMMSGSKRVGVANE
ncbi:MAG: ABC transporter ATP-binding protein [Clostridiales bacterium]|nr:ABC transporter ATP-binding protein [Clostridiales bacterium]